MADTTPQLKRKRESVGAQLKKSKKLRKSEANAGQDIGEDSVVTATPVAQSTSKAQANSEEAPPVPQTNGVHEDEPADTPSSSKQDKKRSNGRQNGIADDSGAQDAPAPVTPNGSREQDKRDKMRRKRKWMKDQVNGGDQQIEDINAQSTPDGPTPPAQNADKSTKKQEKKEKKRDKSSHAKEIVKAQTVTLSSPQMSTLIKTKKQKTKNPAKWSMSPSQGGWFLASDPVFSPDEKYLILANLKSLQVYSTDTSLLANALPVGVKGVVTAYALSSAKSNYIYVADSNGLITLWDWVAGTKIGRWDVGATVRNMTVITQPGSDEDLVYCYETGNSHIINVHALRTKSQASETELKQVLKTSSAILSVQVLLQGKYVVVATADSITVGKRLQISKTAVHDFEYIWRELKFSKRVTTCDMYFRQPEVSEKGKRSAQDQRDVLDLAVGDEIGVILLFEDLLASFAAIESNQKSSKDRTDNAESLRPKRLHWHREAIGSVKWSLDGNYLISGGDETVLTVWQLATGKPQHLPHLTAAIENVVISPSGSSYALSLANNSVIVLSTTELDARANIVGIQSRRVDQEQLPRESKLAKHSFDVFQPVPMVANPKSGKEVLFPVPSSQPRQRSEGLRPEPYLQTFDIANHRPVTRQALTRNNATDPNMGPEGRRIIEPSVTLLQISHDGEWLATVDEWVPPRADTTYLNEGIPEFNEEERLLRREVYLKFWRRDEKNGQWSLEARIDAPHFFEDVCGHGRVFDLVADPMEHGFATIGGDCFVRIWRPKTRLRDGIVVRGAGDKGLVNWSIHRSIQLPHPNKTWMPEVTAVSQQTLSLRTSRLAFSPDGTVLAAAVSGTSDFDSGLVHLLDPFGATIRTSMTEIDVNGLCGVGIVGSHLVVVTDSIVVWDLVNADLVYSIPISTPGIDRLERTSVVRLAINQDDKTFAVSLPQFEKSESSSSRSKKATSKISVYSTEQLEPELQWSHTVPGIVLGFTARKSERGYIALDSVSCIRTITPAVSSVKPSTRQYEKAELLQIENDRVEEDDKVENLASALDVVVEAEEYDRPVVRQQDLEDLFHHTDSALPPPRELFRAVLGLFAGVDKKPT